MISFTDALTKTVRESSAESTAAEVGATVLEEKVTPMKTTRIDKFECCGCGAIQQLEGDEDPSSTMHQRGWRQMEVDYLGIVGDFCPLCVENKDSQEYWDQ